MLVGTFGYLSFADHPIEIFGKNNGGVILLANYHKSIAILIVIF